MFRRHSLLAYSKQKLLLINIFNNSKRLNGKNISQTNPYNWNYKSSVYNIQPNKLLFNTSFKFTWKKDVPSHNAPTQTWKTKVKHTYGTNEYHCFKKGLQKYRILFSRKWWQNSVAQPCVLTWFCISVPLSQDLFRPINL